MKRLDPALRATGLFALRGFSFVMRHAPLPVALAIGRRLGDLTRLVSGKRANVALRNLGIAFGDELTDAERRRIVRECFRHFGMFVVESAVFPFWSNERMLARIEVEPAVLEAVERARAGGHGCVAITAHLGCFELTARVAATLGGEVIVVTRPARDEGTTRFMTELRERQGYQIIMARGTPKGLLQGLRRNALIGIVCDQNSWEAQAPFFGRPAGTATGPARMALRMGSSMFVAICPRVAPGRYRLEFLGDVDTTPTGDTEADAVRIMTDVNALIEKGVRAHPEQWLWFHDRWRASRATMPRQSAPPSEEGD